MNNASRASLYLFAIVLMVIGAVLLGRQFQGGTPIEPLMPCVLALLGVGLFGFGLFSPALGSDDCRTHSEAGPGETELGDGGPD